MKNITNTGKAGKCCKPTTMRGAMVMTAGTLKETSGQISRILRRESGKIHSKDGLHRRLLP
jgi:hypothetical protein